MVAEFQDDPEAVKVLMVEAKGGAGFAPKATARFLAGSLARPILGPNLS